MIHILLLHAQLAAARGYVVYMVGAPEHCIAAIQLAGTVVVWAIAIGVAEVMPRNSLGSNLACSLFTLPFSSRLWPSLRWWIGSRPYE